MESQLTREKPVGFQGFQPRLLERLSHGIVKGSYLSILSQALVSGSNFLTGIIIAKATGVSEFGVFSLIAATVLGMQGIQQALITGPMLFMSRGGEEDKDRISQYFMLQVLLSASLAVAAAARVLPAYKTEIDRLETKI